MSLDYIDHTNLFLNFSRAYHIGAFILHGSLHPHHPYQGYSVRAILRGVDFIPEEHLHSIISEFWMPLATAAQQVGYPANRRLLLMFLVDYSGRVTDWKISCVEKPDEGNWQPQIPISLRAVTKFSADDLKQWMYSWSETLFDVFPDNLRQGPLDIRIRSILEESNDGIPDLVMSHICNQCGFYLELTFKLK